MLKLILLSALLIGLAALVYYLLPQGKQLVLNLASQLNLNGQNLLNQLKSWGQALLSKLIGWINPPTPPAPPAPPAEPPQAPPAA